MMLLTAHLPILQVILPLIAAPLCVLLRGPRLAWGLSVLASWGCFAIAIALLRQVLAEGSVSYALGGWAAPWGIEYRVDVVNAFVLLIVSGISSVVLSGARAGIEAEVAKDRIELLYTCWLLCLAGFLGIAVTGDTFNVFVFLEISAISSYALIALSGRRRALIASFRYLIMGTVGATFIVIGVGLLYMVTGTLNMADIGARLPAVAESRTVAAAFAFLTVGIGLKMALFPLHLWLPNAYTYAPAPVTAFFAGTATKVAVYLLLRFTFTIFGADYAFATVAMEWILLPLAVLGIFSASLVAIFQLDVKRLLAWSSIAQIGYMVLGISLVSVTGLTASTLHLFNHALIKSALFMTMACVFYRIGSTQLADFAGLGRRMPWTMAAFVVGGLSLIGIPLTVGFVSKWYLILALLERGWWPLSVFVVLSSLLAVMYVWRVVEMAYLQPATSNAKPCEAPASILIPTWALVLANLYFGIDSSLTVGIAQRAAESLLGVSS